MEDISAPTPAHFTHHICVIYYVKSNYPMCFKMCVSGKRGRGIIKFQNFHLHFSGNYTETGKSGTHMSLACTLLWINIHELMAQPWMQEKDGNAAVLLLTSGGPNVEKNPLPPLKAALLPSAGLGVGKPHAYGSQYNSLSPSHLGGIMLGTRSGVSKDSRLRSPP